MKYPIGLSIILNALAAISILSGCSDYLDREYDSFIDNEMTFTSYERTSKFLVNAIGICLMVSTVSVPKLCWMPLPMMPNMLMPPATSSTSTPEPGIQGPIRMICGISITQEFA